MKKLICFSLLLTVFLFAGCSMPNTTVRTVDDRPTLAIKGAPAGSILYIDNISIGAAGQYDGDPTVLTVEPGTHVVRVAVGKNTIYEQKVFVESSLKTITIR
ncbi:MAG: hypothetical protein WCA04_15860 [Geobacteraceae bacterium]